MRKNKYPEAEKPYPIIKGITTPCIAEGTIINKKEMSKLSKDMIGKPVYSDDKIIGKIIAASLIDEDKIEWEAEITNHPDERYKY